MNLNLVAGGPLEELPDLRSYQGEEEWWVGVDRGVLTLLSMGLTPVAAFGDFDSVTESEYKLIQQQVGKLKRFEPEKDETDMELALNWALEQKPNAIRLFGATGGRLDHFFANIHLLVKPIVNRIGTTPIEMINKQNIISLRTPGSYELKHIEDKPYISFFPFTAEVSGLTLTNFKYPLENDQLSLGSTRCISNELLHNNGHFSFSSGILMVVRSND